MNGIESSTPISQRISSSSQLPLKNPAMAPSTAPIAVASTATTRPTSNEVRVE
jgi:hypothetical protein